MGARSILYFLISIDFSVLKYSKNTSFGPFILNQILQSNFISKTAGPTRYAVILENKYDTPLNLSRQCSCLGQHPRSEGEKASAQKVLALLKALLIDKPGDYKPKQNNL